MTQPIRILSQPGVQRDGTRFNSQRYVDAQWCRFQQDGLPRKMGGFRAVTSLIDEQIYGMHVDTRDGVNYIHLGGEGKITQVVTDKFGNMTGLNNRTPVGFVTSPQHIWQFDQQYSDTGSIGPRLIAHPGRNRENIDSSVETPIYMGDSAAATAFTELTGGIGSHSGGIVVLHPYLLAFGNAGKVVISPANNPDGIPVNTAYVTGKKIVRGMPVRGNGAGPSGLLWSLDAVIRATFSGSGSGTFAFDTVAGQSSILSPRGVIEYDGSFYWLGVDRPLMYNGVVQRIPNNFNVDWFYDNINMQHRQKVFAFKVPRYGEIWWCFPFGNATECTHALIYNVDGRFWYDTALPTTDQAGRGRTDGYFAQVYSRPFMMDQYNTAEGPGYTLWQHETGTDSINAENIQPIRSFFKTHEHSLLTASQAMDKSLRVNLVEPDFVQSGPLTVTVEGRANARAADRISNSFTITESAASPAEENVPMGEARRLMSFKFESNVVGGDYEMGRVMAHVAPADGRQRS